MVEFIVVVVVVVVVVVMIVVVVVVGTIVAKETKPNQFFFMFSCNCDKNKKYILQNTLST
jgi:hypothetical protein